MLFYFKDKYSTVHVLIRVMFFICFLVTDSIANEAPVALPKINLQFVEPQKTTPEANNKKIPASNIIKIGTMVFNPPFEMNNPAQNIYSGFEIDILNTACQRLKLSCQFVPFQALNDVFNAVAGGQVDIAAASIIILKGDPDHVFSTPYLPSGIQFFVRNKSKIKTIDDITKSTIGTTNDQLIRTLVTVNYAKVHPIKIYPTAQAGIDDLAAGNIDAFVMQTATSKYWVSITSGTFKLIGHPIPIGLGNGAVALASSKSAAIIAQINEAIEMMQQDGTYIEIYNRYILQ